MSAVGFTEDFALSENREEILSKLVPGSEDYFFYKILNKLNAPITPNLIKEVESDLVEFERNFPYSEKRRQLITRSKFLFFDQQDETAKKSFYGWLATQLSLYFNHYPTKTQKASPSTYQSKLDQNIFDLAKYIEGTNYSTSYYKAEADEIWVRYHSSKLDNARLRELLYRLNTADIEHLPELIAKTLQPENEYRADFGSQNVHRLLTLKQLDELRGFKKDLIDNGTYVSYYIERLAPKDNVNLAVDRKEKQEYIHRLENFVRKLSPAYNSMKLTVLYHKLDLMRLQGQYPDDAFLEYLQLPRHADFYEPVYIQKLQNQHTTFGSFGAGVGRLPGVQGSQDNELVKDFLLHSLVKADSFKPYQVYLRESFAKEVFAQAKLLNAVGDANSWYPLLPSEYVKKELLDRVVIQFSQTNPAVFGVNDPVSLKVNVKNVNKLIVKIFEINTTNYYKEFKTEIASNINLDGLVPNWEEEHEFKEAPVVQVLRTFTFPKLPNKRGVFVIEIIGNGQSSRAIVRKGTFRFTERLTVAGHNFMIIDENSQLVKDARIFLAGHLYEAESDGSITIPYSTTPSYETILISTQNGDFTSLANFSHRSENYNLLTKFYVDRESLIRLKKAKVIIRPRLFVNDVPAPLSILESQTVSFTIASYDEENIKTEKVVTPFALPEDDNEASFEFMVSENTRRVEFSLGAKVRVISSSTTQDLRASQSFQLNQIDATTETMAYHLQNTDEGYRILVLGKSGEIMPHSVVNIYLNHKYWSQTVSVTLQSDENGVIHLGALKDILSITSPVWWNIEKDTRSYQPKIHSRVGEVIQIPVMFKSVSRDLLSLQELRGGNRIQDFFQQVKFNSEKSLLEIAGLPEGNFELVLKKEAVTISISVAEGNFVDRFICSSSQILEVVNKFPLQIADISVQQADANSNAPSGNLRIKLTNSTRFTRVHVLATHFAEGFATFELLDDKKRLQPAQVFQFGFPLSDYLSGRTLSEEYRYIIERKYTKKFVGNQLPRPSLLLNPWVIADTKTASQQAAEGGAYAGGIAQDRMRSAAAASMPTSSVNRARYSPDVSPTNIDFLSEPAAVLLNLKPDANKEIVIPLAQLGKYSTLIKVIAVDGEDIVLRNYTIPNGAKRLIKQHPYLDLRLTTMALDPNQHFTEQRDVSTLTGQGSENTFRVADIVTSSVEVYDTIPKIFKLYSTLSGNSTLSEFEFITKWNQLPIEQKSELFSKYCCHELAVFVQRKDPQFFASVVQPYIRNKKQQTFIDEYLLEKDLSKYLTPFEFNRLNTAEQLFLAEKLLANTQDIAHGVKNLSDLLPPDVQTTDSIFKTAIKGSGLDAEDASGMRSQREMRTPAPAPMMERAMLMDLDMPQMQMQALAAPPPMARRSKAVEKKKISLRAEAEDMAEEEMAESYDEEFQTSTTRTASLKKDLSRRERQQKLFQQIEKTQQYAENNYWHTRFGTDTSQLIQLNAFWSDYAQHLAATGGNSKAKPFVSKNFGLAHRSFPEMMFALALLDVSFGPAQPNQTDVQYNFDGPAMSVVSNKPVVIFHKQIKTAQAEASSVLVSQNYFNPVDQYNNDGPERTQKFITKEFLVRTVYACQIVLTNVSMSNQKLDVLLQIPAGSLPVSNGFFTKSKYLELSPYTTTTITYYFYFPLAGKFSHFPVHVTKRDTVIAFAAPFVLNVVEEATIIDTSSWEYISQNASDAEVLAYLQSDKVYRVAKQRQLNRIAWRMKTLDTYQQVISILRKKSLYDETLWSYSAHHQDVQALKEYLPNSYRGHNHLQPFFQSSLVSVDPFRNGILEHTEFSPLVNARVYMLGKERKILNDKLKEEYTKLCNMLCYKSPANFSNTDLLSLTYHMLLQDRIDEARQFFAHIKPGNNDELGIQYDYMLAYLDFFNDTPSAAEQIAAKYAQYPVPRWRRFFSDISEQLDEIHARPTKTVKTTHEPVSVNVATEYPAMEAQQAKLASSSPSLDFAVEAKKINIAAQNVKQVTIGYYLVDLELMFSTNPFVAQEQNKFLMIKPNRQDTVDIPATAHTHSIDLPAEFHNANVVINISGQGLSVSHPYYSNSLNIQIMQNYGQLKAVSNTDGHNISKAYVKVYAKHNTGEVRFYKDGYTDLRGKYDYAALSTSDLDTAEKFAILIISEKNGSTVKEVAKPKS